MASAAVALAIIPFIADRSAALSLALIGVWGFSVFCSAPAINTYIVQSVPRSAHVILSLNTSCTHLGLALGASAGGWLIQFKDTGLYHPWLASGLVLAALIAGALTVRRQPGAARIKDTRPSAL
ncbi:Purine efflux pump PbuE [compost metagenome]